MKIKQKSEEIIANKKRKFLSFPMIMTVLTMLFFLQAGLETFGTLEEHHGCTMILVGKDATADGSVLISYNNDASGKGASHVVVVPRKSHKPGTLYKLSNAVEIPQPAETYAYIGNAPQRTRAPYFQNGVNEYQVAISFGTAVKVNEKAKEVDPLRKEGPGIPGLLIPWSLVLERAKTAREGVDLVEKLFNKYGLKEDGSFAIADPNEIWLFQIGGGHHWAAVRVPDNSYVIQDNTFRMDELDCTDKASFRFSPHLVEFSKEKGLYDPVAGPFNFKKSWGHIYTRTPPTDHRIWRVQSLLTPSASLPPATPYFDFPLFLVPEQKITKEMLMSIMRDHLEGTELDTTNAYKQGNPHFMNEYTLCRTNTQYSVITQLRSWLPSEIGGVMWLAMATPDTSVYVPWYMGITEVPYVYQFGKGKSDPESAYWAFKRISNLVNTHYGDLKEEVRNTWKAFEEREFEIQESVEKTALELFQKDKSIARTFLSSYSNAQALKAYNMAQEMINELQTKLVDLLKRRVEK
jgi:dipeptidase